jgi:hypothetical protein
VEVDLASFDDEQAVRIAGPETQVVGVEGETHDRFLARGQVDAAEATQSAHRLHDARGPVVHVQLDDLVARTGAGVAQCHGDHDRGAVAQGGGVDPVVRD